MDKTTSTKTKKETKIAVLVVAAVLVIGVFAFFFLFRLSGLRCGDGVCQRWEEKNNICPIDCKSQVIDYKAAPKKAVKSETKPPLKIKKMTTIKTHGKSLDWSHKKGLILSSRFGLDGYFDIISFRPDGSHEKCLTCNKEGISKKHIGNPSWYPGGEYIVFTAQKDEVPDDMEDLIFEGIPGRGLNNDLYVMDADGSQFWKIYEIPLELEIDIPAVIHPQFSHNGKMLTWAERIGRSERPALGWGEWALKLADFEITNEGPVLSNIQTIQPGKQIQFYESHDFSLDDTKILFSGNLEKGQYATGLDIYEYTIGTKKISNLTSTRKDWDEHAHWSPDGTKIVWMSSTGFKIDYPDQKDWHEYLKTELWAMNADGSQQSRLTNFNTPGNLEYKAGSRVIVGDSDWGPDGKHLVLAIAYTDPPSGDLKHWNVIMVEFE